MTDIKMAPPTPPPATLLTIVLRSSEPPPAAAPPITLWRSAPPRPPPTIPAIELAAVPRLFSFIAAPAMLPPTAPLTASIIRLIMFIRLDFDFVRVSTFARLRTRRCETSLTADKAAKRIDGAGNWESDFRAVSPALMGRYNYTARAAGYGTPRPTDPRFASCQRDALVQRPRLPASSSSPGHDAL